MSTKSEIDISIIWDIFKVEIVLEAPGGKLISKSRWGEGWKEEGNFFLISLGETKKKRGGGQGNWLFIPFLVGEEDLKL